MAAEPGAVPPTLLIVDDEDRILSALRRTLHREGYILVDEPDAAHDRP